jgi:L-fuconolactonase
MNRIDAHTHVYSTDDGRYPTIGLPTRPPGVSGSFATLKKLASENGISRICAIQPSSFYRWDNRFVCDLALAEPDFVATICTLNPEDPLTPVEIARLKREFGIRGIRSLPASDGRFDHSGVRALWKACADHNLTINVLTKYDNASQLAHLLADFPSVRCVIDHCLFLASGPAKEPTLTGMLELAKYPNAFAKVSFLPLGSTAAYPYSDLHAPCHRIIETYTSERCLWGSNFPCELWSPKSSYGQNVELFTAILGLDQNTQADLFWNVSYSLWFEGK